jgi:hypothetical protein
VIDTLEVETRLRATFEAVAATTTVQNKLAPGSPPDSDPTPDRQGSRGVRVAATAVVVIVVAMTAALVLVHHRAGQSVQVRTAQTTAHTNAPTTPTIPRVVSGTQQHFRNAAIPTGIGGLFASGPLHWHVVAGTAPHAYSVDGGTSLVVADVATMGDGPAPYALPGACSLYMGTLPIGGQGLGIQVGCTPLRAIAAGSSQAVAILHEFPAHLHSTTVWAHLPVGTRYVTFTAEGVAHLWEQPVDGVAAFTVVDPAKFNGANSDAQPSPILRAYDSNGRLLQQVIAPRFLGDPRTTHNP